MERNISLDLAKLVCAVMVVFLHANFLAEFSPLANYLTVHGVFRIAVPFFLIVSGYYFYSALVSGKEIAWLTRLALLYLIWMIVYANYWFYVPEMSVKAIAKIFLELLVG